MCICASSLVGVAFSEEKHGNVQTRFQDCLFTPLIFCHTRFPTFLNFFWDLS